MKTRNFITLMLLATLIIFSSCAVTPKCVYTKKTTKIKCNKFTCRK